MIKKILINTALIGAIAATSVFAANIETKADLKAQIKDLRSFRAELKHKIDSKEITKIEANKIWKSKVEELKKLKEEFFKKRIENIEKKSEVIKKYSPEIFVKINQKISLFKNKRTQILEIKNRVREGEIKKAEAKELIKKIKNSFKIQKNEINQFLINHKKELMDLRKKMLKAKKDGIQDINFNIKEEREKMRKEFEDQMNRFGEERKTILDDIKAITLDLTGAKKAFKEAEGERKIQLEKNIKDLENELKIRKDKLEGIKKETKEVKFRPTFHLRVEPKIEDRDKIEAEIKNIIKENREIRQNFPKEKIEKELKRFNIETNNSFKLEGDENSGSAETHNLMHFGF